MNKMAVGSDTLSRGGADLDDYDVYTVQGGGRYWICRPKVMACVSLLLGLSFVFIGATISSNRRIKGEKEGNDTTTTNVGDYEDISGDHSDDIPEIEIVPPPFNLVELCDWDSIVLEDGLAVCEMTCQQASCCQPSSGSKNCFSESSDICLQYTACYAVITEQYGPAIGSTDQSSTDFKLGEIFGESGVGLYYGYFNSTVNQTSDASEVPTLENENGTSLYDNVPPTLSEVCNRSDLTECSDLCEQGRCCFEPDNDCGFNEGQNCYGYEPCGVLDSFDDVWNLANLGANYGETAITNATGGSLYYDDIFAPVSGGTVDAIMMAAPIKEACSPENISQLGIQTCEDMCMAFQCCFEEGASNCRDINDCEGMGAPCTIIYGEMPPSSS